MVYSPFFLLKMYFLLLLLAVLALWAAGNLNQFSPLLSASAHSCETHQQLKSPHLFSLPYSSLSLSVT
jgi:hypothetical protein